MQSQFSALDRTDGDIDALQTRLARVRTLAYIANRSDWLADPAGWQGEARALEDRLSDTLHQSLMQRFVDRRTSALMRSLHQHGGPVLGGVAADGDVTVEGHVVGRLMGVHFEPVRGGSALEDRAIRGAVERAVAPEVARRLGELAGETDEAFALRAGGIVAWRGVEAGVIAGGTPFKPRVRLIGEFGADAARERAARRLEAYAAAEASRRLAPLKALTEAIADGRLRGLARGVAYQLVEQSGVLDRRRADDHIRALSRGERRVLKSFGVRFGAFALYLPGVLTAEARTIGEAFATLAAPRWRPPSGAAPALLPHPQPPPEALGLRGLAAVAGLAIPVLQLEKFDALARAAAPGASSLLTLTAELLEAVGWKTAEADPILRALGFVRARRTPPGEPTLWRRRPYAESRPQVGPSPPRPAPRGEGRSEGLGDRPMRARPAPHPDLLPAGGEKERANPNPQPARKERRRRRSRRPANPSGMTA